MKKRIKTLIIDITGTTPSYTSYFCDALNNIGIVATIAGVRRDETKYLRHHKTRYSRLSDFSGLYHLKLLSSFFKTTDYILNWMYVLFLLKKYNVIHIQWLPGLRKSSLEIYLLKLLLLLNRNIVYHVHDVLPHDNKSMKVNEIYRKLYKVIPNIVVHTEKTRNKLIQEYNFNNDRITIMPHGPMFAELIQETIMSNNKHSTKILGMIGSIRPYKGIEDAIRSLSILVDSGVRDVKLLIAGNGSAEYIRELDSLISQLELEPYLIRVYRYLEVPEMIEFFQMSSIILAPYKNIDQSGVVITALSGGVPVVAYKVGGIQDLILSGYNGQLIEEGNVKQFANGIRSILDSNLEEIKNNCIKSMERFSWDSSANILRNLYFELIEEQRKDVN